MKRSNNILLALCLAACGNSSGPSGEYHSNKLDLGLVFDGKGQVTMTTPGGRVAAPYTVDGGRVLFHIPGGESVSFEIKPDGTLSHPVLGDYKKT